MPAADRALAGMRLLQILSDEVDRNRRGLGTDATGRREREGHPRPEHRIRRDNFWRLEGRFGTQESGWPGVPEFDL